MLDAFLGEIVIRISELRDAFHRVNAINIGDNLKIVLVKVANVTTHMEGVVRNLERATFCIVRSQLTSMINSSWTVHIGTW